jgi:oligoribonuclease
MTGLNLANDALVEIAVIVTDAELNPLGEGVEAVIKPPAAAIDQMSDYVREMHAHSGLLTRLDGGVSLAEAEEAVMTYIRSFVPEARKAPLAGNSVGMDRLFISRDMPELDAHLHYRVVDVSSIKELARRWYPKTYFSAPAKTGNHRALGDIQDSINELRYYRETVFVPAPGLDSESAKAAAARYSEPERDR